MHSMFNPATEIWKDKHHTANKDEQQATQQHYSPKFQVPTLIITGIPKLHSQGSLNGLTGNHDNIPQQNYTCAQLTRAKTGVLWLWISEA